MEIEFDSNFLKDLERAQTLSLEMTAEDIRSDIIISQTMPFDVGTLQNESTYVQVEDDEVQLVSNTPYARRLYFHPEYNFQRGKNPNAGGRWFDPYLAGHEKGEFAEKSFAYNLQKNLRGWLA